MSMEDKQDAGTQTKKLVPIPVSPKACLWFAWADSPISGPEGEADTSYPTWVAAEEGASRVIVSVTNRDARWMHHPDSARASGPNGLDGSNGTPVVQRGLQNPSYKSSAYNSAYIEPLQSHLNKLVAMFEMDNAAPTLGSEATQLEVGEEETFDVPPGATRLFLGFHDGRHWTNNDGESMMVEITWVF